MPTKTRKPEGPKLRGDVPASPLQARRLRAGLTQQELANRTFSCRSWIAVLETRGTVSGQRPATIYMLAQALGCKFKDIKADLEQGPSLL